MKRAFNIVAAILLIVSFAAPVAAGPPEDFTAAYKKGDYAAALRVLRPLADQGDADAESNLGLIYETGRGVQQDFREAAKWYRRAADQGNAFAQAQLAALYMLGRGVPRDDVLAYMWFNLAAAQGEKLGIGRDVEAEVMTPDQIAEAQRLSRDWKPTTHPTKQP